MSNRLGFVSAVAVGLLTTGAARSQAQTSPKPTFTKDVAPILYANCTTCHRPGEIAPMSLLTYRDGEEMMFTSLTFHVPPGRQPSGQQ